jgi:HK97 family phage portal protein
MRLWRSRRSAMTEPGPPYSRQVDFVSHALNNSANGWIEPLFGMRREVGTVDRCLQLNAQQIAKLDLRYKHSTSTQGFQPKWVTDPDPAWYPNGIKQVMHAIVRSIYAQGDAFLYVTSRYETGYPQTWTMLDAVTMKVDANGGSRTYESNHAPLNPRDVIQITRNPNGALRGTSALEAYWSNVSSAYAAESYAADVYYSTGVNRVALRSARRIDAAQAADVQAQWVAAVSKRMGAPAIIPPDLELLESLSISPKDMMLLESREWDATQIAAAFGVPAVLLNIAISGGLVYQAPVQLFELWWRAELSATAIQIQEALSRWLPRGSWVEFDPSAILQPDREKMIAIHSKALADGAITLDEYRAAVFDLPPLAAGDQAAGFYEEAGAHGGLATEEVLAP